MAQNIVQRMIELLKENNHLNEKGMGVLRAMRSLIDGFNPIQDPEKVEIAVAMLSLIREEFPMATPRSLQAAIREVMDEVVTDFGSSQKVGCLSIVALTLSAIFAFYWPHH